jgi:hypothetical protein
MSDKRGDTVGGHRCSYRSPTRAGRRSPTAFILAVASLLCRRVICLVSRSRCQVASVSTAQLRGGSNSTFNGTSVAFPTDPSGVFGGTQFDPDYQFSPKRPTRLPPQRDPLTT